MTTDASPPARSQRHSRGDVVEAALAILDEHGLPDLTMRRLASTLAVQPSALYWHFENKQTLLAAVSDRIVHGARARDHGESDWASAVRFEAEVLRDALLSFRDGAEVVLSSQALGLGAGEALTRLTAAIHLGDFDERVERAAAGAFLHFLLGHVSHEQQRLQADSLGIVTARHEAKPSDAESRSRHERDSFEFGVSLLIAGLTVQSEAIRQR
ncbi:TetR family transcriptional regulator [Agreia pratensis]|uniref:TetR family transcriptional regulator n=1 Tax=Agreia pratensis TaxID=150121 RepID=UPI00188AEEC4|nr:TetR family transcriptional regulator [Agreia pratensis]MBF4634078.1 TetR family transcriptional regulator [Agreia pratensis]